MEITLTWQAMTGLAVIMSAHVALMKLIVDKAVDKLNIQLVEKFVSKIDCAEKRHDCKGAC